MSKVTSSNPFDLLEEIDYDGQMKPVKAQPKAKAAPAKVESAPKSKDSRPRDSNRGPRGGNADFESSRAPRNTDKKRHTKAAPRRGREFDRHSGTGRVDSEKATEQFVGKATENYEEIAKADGEAEKKAGAEAQTPPAEPEDHSKTLDEYYRELKATKASGNEAKEVRKPNEGADDSKWKDTVVLKKEEEDFFTGKASGKARKNKEKNIKTFVDVEVKFNEPEKEKREFRRNDRGGRDNRGRGGRGGRGNPRGNASKNNPRPIPLNDQVAFPSLGSN